MRNKIVGIIALAGLLAGCECAPEKEVEVACGPVPGSAADFKANVPDRVFFGFNKYNITDESRRTLEAQATWFRAYPTTTGVVEGHCDSRGTREYNLALGQRRANAAHNTLSGLGVEGGRLKTVSYGKEHQPVPGASTEEAHAQNRVAITTVN
jgi:peptidoglycan-associated lipoprotein